MLAHFFIEPTTEHLSLRTGQRKTAFALSLSLSLSPRGLCRPPLWEAAVVRTAQLKRQRTGRCCTSAAHCLCLCVRVAQSSLSVCLSLSRSSSSSQLLKKISRFFSLLQCCLCLYPSPSPSNADLVALFCVVLFTVSVILQCPPLNLAKFAEVVVLEGPPVYYCQSLPLTPPQGRNGRQKWAEKGCQQKEQRSRSSLTSSVRTARRQKRSRREMAVRSSK